MTARGKRQRIPLVAALGCLAFVCLAGPPLAAAADAVGAGGPNVERTARQHFSEGEADYAAGRYAQALARYQAGYDVQPLPGFLVNIAQCQRRLGDLERARATYQRFLLVAPDSPLVPEVRQLVEEVDRLLAETEAAARLPSAAAGSGQADSAVKGTPPGPSLGAPTPPLFTSLEPVTAKDESAAQAPVHRRWWLWGAIGAVVAGGVTAAVLLSAPEATTIHDGSLGTLRR